MVFAFKSRSGVSSQVRAIVHEQVEKALSATVQAADIDKTVHALRRRCKRLRGMLRMVQPHFKDFAQQNTTIRDAADLLGGARDARVMVETLDALVSDQAGHGAAGQAVAARQFLVARLQRLSQDSDLAETLAQFSQTVGPLEASIAHWKFDQSGFELLGDGLQQTYGAFRTLAAEAEKHESAAALHDWRKQTKYHGHHVALLSQAAPDVLHARGNSLERLGEYLGDHHNLAVLGDTLHDGGLDDIGAIDMAIAARQHELARLAFVLGRQLVVEKPAALRQRFAGYWHLLPEED